MHRVDPASAAGNRRPAHRRRRERGQSLVELALSIPLFLVLVFAVVDIGMGLHAYITVTNAAREGARVGAVCPDGESGSATAAVEDAIMARVGSLKDANVTIPPPTVPCDKGEDVVVRVDYDYEYITPLGNFVGAFSGGSLQLSSTTIMRSE